MRSVVPASDVIPLPPVGLVMAIRAPKGGSRGARVQEHKVLDKVVLTGVFGHFRVGFQSASRYWAQIPVVRMQHSAGW